MVHVPYKEAAQIYIAVANGDVDFVLGSVGSSLSLVKAGKLKLLALAAKARDPEHPDIPTVEQAGGPAGYQGDTWGSIVAPPRMPSQLARPISGDHAPALAPAGVGGR